jgi:MFS family permease
MTSREYRVYAYRWVMLAAFMLINLTLQTLWISFAAITEPAVRFYGVSDLQIGFLAMSFMIIYIPLSIPAAWAIDTWGLRKAVGLGAVLLGIFGLLRGLLAANFTAVLVCTLGVAVAQPFLLNAVTALAAKWFPIDERATASGLALVAVFVGIALGMVVTPILSEAYGIPASQLVFGALAALSAVVFLILAREAPPTPPCPPGQETRALVLDGLKSMLRLREMWVLLFVFLVGQGIFNGVSTWIDEIVHPRGFSTTQAGVIGACLLLGGIAGAAIIPAISDRLHRRKIFMVLGLVLGLPGLVGLTLAPSYAGLIVSALVLGFFMTGLAPVVFQYGAEITYPAPEGTSLGLLNLVGQASVVFVFAMQALRSPSGSYLNSLFMLAGLMAVAAVLIASVRDSTLIRALAEGEPAVSTSEAS